MASLAPRDLRGARADGDHVIHDVCLFWNELDVLELRLRELDSLVDRFVVIQGTETFAGTPKPLALDVTAPRWAPWAGRLKTVTTPTLPPTAGRWDREGAARDMALVALADAAPDDLVLYSDLDEIPDAEVVRRYLPSVTDTTWVGFRPPVFYYYLNLQSSELWSAIALTSVATLRTLGPRRLRDLRHSPPILGPRNAGGWHVTWLGGVAQMQAKLSAWPHGELDTPAFHDPAHLAKCVAGRRDLFNRRRYRLTQVPMTALPLTVQRDPARWAAYLIPEIA